MVKFRFEERILTLKALITAAVDTNFYLSEKTGLDILCKLSVRQTIHMKCQDIFFSERYFFKTVICYKFSLAR